MRINGCGCPGTKRTTISSPNKISQNISENRAGRKKELWDGKECSEMLSAG